MNNKLIKAITLSIAGMMYSSVSLAALEIVTFQDTTGQQRTIKGRDLGLVNVNGEMKLFVSSGLDRKISANLRKGQEQVETKVSDIINIYDRLDVNGKQYYGKIITFDKVSQADGNYTIEIEYKDLSEVVKATETYTLTQETVKPTINGEFIYIRNAYYGTIDNFGHTGTTKQLEVRDVSDASGIEVVKYWVKQPDGSKKYKDVAYNADEQKVIVPGSIAATNGAGLVPSAGYYEIGIDVYDSAGNMNSISRFSHIDLSCPSNSNNIIQVLNASSGLWENYESGMMIYANPVTLRYGRLLSDFATDESPYGWKKLNHMVTNTDSTYAYHQPTINYPQPYSYFSYYSESGHPCYSHAYRDLNFSLSPGVEPAPKYTGASYKTTLSSEWVNSYIHRTNEPVTINKVRIYAEERTYRQKLTISSGGSCYLEPGDNYCDVDTNYVRSSGRGYIPYPIYAAKSDNTMSTHGGYLLTYYDFNKVEVKSVSYNKAGKSIKIHTYDADTVSDWRSSMWKVSSVSGSAVINGESVDLPALPAKQIDLQNHEYIFDVSGLNVEQSVPFTFIVRDTYGNKTNVVQNFTIDTVEPTINVKYEGNSLPSVITDIRELEFYVNDFSPATLTTVQLLGSDANEDVYLGIIDEGQGQYTVAKPKIFPTLNYDSGERYRLIISAQDEQGNNQTKEVAFGYQPNNLIVVDMQQYLPVNKALYDVTGKALARIYSDSPLTLDGGQRATGHQTAEFTNRKDSDFAISIIGASGVVKAQPGETKTVIIDLGATGDALSVEVFPSEDQEGEAQFMFSIPSLSSIY